MVSLIKENTKNDSLKENWIDRQYHVQDNAAIKHQDMKMYFNTSKFPELSFCGP